jgi:hypothetical protein
MGCPTTARQPRPRTRMSWAFSRASTAAYSRGGRQVGDQQAAAGPQPSPSGCRVEDWGLHVAAAWSSRSTSRRVGRSCLPD